MKSSSSEEPRSAGSRSATDVRTRSIGGDGRYCRSTLDVAFNHPLIGSIATHSIRPASARTNGLPDVFECAVAAPSGPEPIGDLPESRLEDRLQDLDRALHHAISNGGDTKGSELPRSARLRNPLPPGATVGSCRSAAPPATRPERAVRLLCQRRFATVNPRGVRLPLLWAIECQAQRRLRGSVTQPHLAVGAFGRPLSNFRCTPRSQALSA